jgi:hypothetical protein
MKVSLILTAPLLASTSVAGPLIRDLDQARREVDRLTKSIVLDQLGGLGIREAELRRRGSTPACTTDNVAIRKE